MRALSLRLNSLLELCLPGLPLWDLCCDHGLLGLAALERGQFSPVYFNDAVPHVLDDLKTRALSDRTDAHLVYGLAEAIAQPLTGNVVLAGIGAEKSARILHTHLAAGRLKAERVIICPEKDAEWFAQQTFPGYEFKSSFAIAHNHGQRRIFTLEDAREH